MATRRRRRNVLTVVLVLLVALVAVGITLNQAAEKRNRNHFEDGQHAYLAGDCALALAAFDAISGSQGGYDKKAQPLQTECEPVAAARSKEIASPDAALVEYTTFVLNNPQSPLVEPIAARIAVLAGTRSLAELASSVSCAALPDLERSGLASAAKLDLGLFGLECARQAAARNDLEEQARLQLAFLAKFGTRAEAAAVETALLANVGTCSQLDAIAAEPALVARPGFVASLTFLCAKFSESTGKTSDAVTLYQRFVSTYPNDVRIAEAQAGLARSLIAQAKAEGAGQLPTPSPSGGATSGTVSVVIDNASPDSLRIVLNGAETRIEMLGACEACVHYSNVGPSSCPSELPSLTLQLTPGVYDVLVESTEGSSVTPYVGSWDLKGGTRYESCFFIVRRSI